jgi:hypothetical protein
LRIKRNISLLALSGLLTVVAYGQQNQPNTTTYAADKANVPDAIAKLKSGHFSLVHVEMIATAGAVEAIPALKEQFPRSQDPLVKAKIANALVRLGDREDIYWDYLVQQVTPALESDAPDFINYDSTSGGGPSPAFSAWAKAHGESLENAGQNAMYWLPGKVILLGSTGDKRAIPLLQRGLLSPNHMIVIAAAEGLSELQDKDSIRLIIDACKRAPAGAAAVIAESLVYFDDAEAQSAFDTYASKDRVKILRESKAQGKKTPFSN